MMAFLKYCEQYPLTRPTYERGEVQKIRQHAFTFGRRGKTTRSGQQNNYYWGVVCSIISEETGYDPEEIHQILARQFLSYEHEGLMFVKSTTRLKISEFEDYMERCRRFASMELDCYIPLPHEAGEYFYENPLAKKNQEW